MADNRRNFMPFPNWFDPRGKDAPRYRVIDSATLSGSDGQTDKRDGVFAIPLNEEGRVITDHELGHVMWSPVDVPKPNARFPASERLCYIALEEMRVNMGMAKLGFPLDWGSAGKYTNEHTHALRHPERGSLRSAVLNCIAAFGTSEEIIAMRAIGNMAKHGNVGAADEVTIDSNGWPEVLLLVQEVHRRADKAFRRAKGKVPSDRTMRKMAHWLDQRFSLAERKRHEKNTRSPRKTGEPRRSRGFEIGSLARCHGDISPKKRPLRISKPWPPPQWWRPQDDWIKKHGWTDTHTYRNPEGYTLNGFAGPIRSDVMPGMMNIEEPCRHSTCETIKQGKRRAYANVEEGTSIGEVYRVITDRRIFRRKRKRNKGGGTVLFDLSGSMGSLSMAIDEVVSNNPNATTVATYSGNGMEGVLRVVVKDGHRADAEAMEPPGGHGNVVDVPALDWLSRQPAPRVWVSDQCVTGQDDRGSTELLDACHALCNSFNITILESPHDVAAHLKAWSEGVVATGIDTNAYGDREDD